ncbi:MAG TPA: hypothetical protein PKO06_02875 [Candidatus Ozemobacteraceae bacterium]|nr:hypothetical protein [Candidatus Ozemobacteraceae bacterium]
MKKVLFAVLMVMAICLPSFAEEPAPAAAPAADAAKPADAAAPAPAADAKPADAAAPAPAVEKFEGTVVVVKGAEGAADTYTLKTAAAELVLLPGDKLEELKKVADLDKKTFVIEGEKVAGKDGKDGIMIKSFEEKKADAAAPAPATEEKK